MPVGVGVDDVTVDADGDLRTLAVLVLLPMPDGRVTTLPTACRSKWTTPDGAMLTQRPAGRRPAPSRLNCRIERNDSSRWQVVVGNSNASR